ncbi:MAG TPA: universal stress protein, partial [Blastocatellia bacterium]|nr:universal stress protein [Blastocatellia bacterium]
AIARRPWPTGSMLEILSVAEQPYLPTTETWALPDSSFIEAGEAAQEQAQTAVNGAEQRVRQSLGAALEIIPKVVEGHTVSRILEEAESWGADLIVLGSHGYRGLTRFLLGSVSNAVATHAKCSVEIVRSPQTSLSTS